MGSWEELSSFNQWMGEHVPGLSTDKGRKARVGYGFSQVMQTPTDLTVSDLIPEDVPYAGVFGGYGSWYSLSNKTLRGFQLFVGILGPTAQAEDVQKFIHNDLGLGTDPKGWDNQLNNELLVNINYELSRKVWSYGEFGPGKFMTDIAVGGGGALGNYYTGLTGQLEWRIGWGVPRGFATLVESDGRGIWMNPVLDAPHDRWSVYFSFIPKVSVIGYTVLYETNTFTDHPHPGVDYDATPLTLNYGLHISKGRFSIHFNASYHPKNLVENELDTDTSFGSLTFEYLF